MKFRPPEHRVPKLTSEVEKKHGDEFEVSFCVVILTFPAANHVNNIKKLETLPDLAQEMDIDLGLVPMLLDDAQFVEGGSVY
jgi:hypothetical protein